MPDFKKFFSRKPRVGRPVATPTAANVNYPNTPIVIQTPLAAPPVPIDTIQAIKHKLDEIGSTQIGTNLFLGLQNAGKPIGVRYAGQNNNSAAGAPRGYAMLRQKHDADDKAGFGHELNLTLQKVTGKPDLRMWFARALRAQHVPTWQGATIRPFHGRPGNTVRPAIADWIAGTTLPTKDEADAIMLVLKNHLNPGPGVSTKVYFDPLKDIVNGAYRPPCVGLFHELMHAYYNATGGQLGREDSLNEGNGGRLFEAMAVGLGDFGNAPLSENGFRRAINFGDRTTYP